MNSRTERHTVDGPAGLIECAIDAPSTPAIGSALVCHPHPLHGGTLDNKVAQTLARAFTILGYTSVRFNFRGVGASQGAWDEGRGEIDDALAVMQVLCAPHPPLVLAGFSFGAYVASQVAVRLPEPAEWLVLVGPAVQTLDVAPATAGSLVIQGELDDVVPLAAVLDWARPQALPVTVVPGAGHFFHGQLPLLKHIVTSSWPRAGKRSDV
jgi:uncharacterized protein